MSFEHLFTNNPIQKEIKIAGVSETYYFRKLTAGEQITLNWISEIQPVMLTSSREPDFTYIVMPIRMD